MTRQIWLALAIIGMTACDRATGPDGESPTNLSYLLDASGDPQAPSGVTLFWDDVSSASLTEYRVYSRPNASSGFDLRGSTTSTSFHDGGAPDMEYRVTAVYGKRESEPSNTVTITGGLRLDAPQTITSLSLNGAIHLSWSDNPYNSNPARFRWYRVYSTSYNLDTDLCGTTWSVEGTTVSSSFLSANLTNGVPRCFAVSAESLEGYESQWSPLHGDTPRPDGRNILLFPLTVDATRAGFRFFLDGNGDGNASPLELGNVADGNRTDIDFRVYVDGSDRVWMLPIRTGTTVALYGNAPITDLTSIDVAPTTGFAATAIEAVAGWGYVFKMSGGDAFARFGGLRVEHASKDYVIFDWSYQTDPGNPELVVVAK